MAMCAVNRLSGFMIMHLVARSNAAPLIGNLPLKLSMTAWIRRETKATQNHTHTATRRSDSLHSAQASSVYQPTYRQAQRDIRHSRDAPPFAQFDTIFPCAKRGGTYEKLDMKNWMD